MRALRDNAGSIKEGAHDAVLTTVLSMSLWSCSAVSSCCRDALAGILLLTAQCSCQRLLRAGLVQLWVCLVAMQLLQLKMRAERYGWYVAGMARELLGSCHVCRLSSLLCCVCLVLQVVRKSVLDLVVELIATSSTFIGNCLQVRRACRLYAAFQ